MKHRFLIWIFAMVLLMPSVLAANVTIWLQSSQTGDVTPATTNNFNYCIASLIDNAQISGTATEIAINVSGNDAWANYTICEQDTAGSNNDCIVGTRKNFTFGGVFTQQLTTDSLPHLSDPLTYTIDTSKDYLLRHCIDTGHGVPLRYQGGSSQLSETVGSHEINIDAWGDSFTVAAQYSIWNLIATAQPAPDTTPPHITAYSNQGSSCSGWNINTANPCSTSDTTPTLYFNTSESAFCAIGISNLNYTTMGSSRNCTSGEGTIEHSCTLTTQDELVYENSIVYLSCKDLSGNYNATSTSGPLSLTITGLEAIGNSAIETGIQSALTSGYTIYTNQKIYARNSANQQSVGTFDKVVKWMNKVWAFNFLTGNDTRVNMFNITPVLYTLEMTNITNTTINTTVYNFIQSTR